MATTTITELRTIDQIKNYLLLAADDVDETFNLSIDLLFQYIKNGLNPTPTGSILMWSGEIIPNDYTELDGKSFDPQIFPELGALFPSGILPDTRGMALKHAPDGRNVLSFESGAVISHSHNASASTNVTVNITNLGTKNTELGGEHNHGGGMGGANHESEAGFAGGNYRPIRQNTDTHSPHAHSIVMGHHNHSASASTSVTVAATGGGKNLVDNIAVKFIVKKA